MGLICFVFLFGAADFHAQDPATSPAATDAGDAPPKAPTTLLDMIIGGGIFMVPIGLLSVWMISLAIFLGLQLRKNSYIPLKLKAEILDLMSEVKVRSVIEIASQSPSFLGRMAAHSYIHVDATDTETLGRSKVEDAMSDFVIRESLGTYTWIGYLSVIAQGATMLGLFGTVAGMVLAFDSMGLSGGSNPSALASNISLALITTAGGLVVAIPAIFAFYAMKNKYNRLIADSQQVIIKGLETALMSVNADQTLSRVPEGISEA
ncbi:MAG TPA: MotA/TolQ/ExbB proton channel family protein [Bacteroidia bacterium]|nr:MotA/TolQ/ExbB proton channel family protein [Bacteroidia bacterium]